MAIKVEMGMNFPEGLYTPMGSITLGGPRSFNLHNGLVVKLGSREVAAIEYSKPFKRVFHAKKAENNGPAIVESHRLRHDVELASLPCSGTDSSAVSAFGDIYEAFCQYVRGPADEFLSEDGKHDNYFFARDACSRVHPVRLGRFAPGRWSFEAVQGLYRLKAGTNLITTRPLKS